MGAYWYNINRKEMYRNESWLLLFFESCIAMMHGIRSRMRPGSFFDGARIGPVPVREGVC